jgi:hypothetical protein
MHKYLLPLLLVFAQPAVAQEGQQWFKGNLHTHSYWSDGDEFPEMIMDWYKLHGYDFVALSDHNTLAEGEKWKLITKNKTHIEGFEKYLAKYGKEWVTYRMDTGRIHVKLKTLAEYRTLFEDQSFLLIQAEELTDKFENKQVHMNAINVQSAIQPQGGSSLQEVMQRNLDAIMTQRKATNVPIMQHLNHPNFYYSITAQNIIDLRGERFFEVYNGHPLVHNYGDSTHPGTEQMWDEINIAYVKQGKPLLYGLATDDSHNYHIFGSTQSNSGRGWVMVNAEALTPAALIGALEEGKFYASTGLSLSDITVRDNVFNVKVKEEQGVSYKIEFIGAKAGDSKSKILATTAGGSAQFKLTDKYVFVRAKVTSSKAKTNPLGEDENEAAWVQPVRYQRKR